jgi:hypothetical protein
MERNENRQPAGSPLGGGRFAPARHSDSSISLVGAIPQATLTPAQRRRVESEAWRVLAREHFRSKTVQPGRKPYRKQSIPAQNIRTEWNWNQLKRNCSNLYQHTSSDTRKPDSLQSPQASARPRRPRKLPKVGLREFSPRKSIAARTTGRLTRALKRAIIPWYGKKGVGWIRNPKRALRSAIYHRTTFGITDLF